MELRGRIQHLLQSFPAIYNQQGELVSPADCVQQYSAIKAYLLDQKPDIIAIQLAKDYQYVLCMLACMEIGIPYVPLHIQFPEKRVEQIQQLSGFSIRLDQLLYEQIIQTPVDGNLPDLPTVSGSNTLYIMFTSGSTGEPKGVVIPREAYTNFLNWLEQTFALSNQDVVLNTTEFTFDVSLVDVGHLLTRQPTMVFSNFDNNLFKFLHELEHYKVSVIATVPNNFSMIFRDDIMSRVDLSRLRLALIAGSRFPKKLYDHFKHYTPALQVYNCYGPTEFTIYCLFKKMDNNHDLERDIVSIGEPVLSTTAKIVDDDFVEVDPLVEGELIVAGVQLMTAYQQNPEKTAEVIVELEGIRYYRTGDLVFKNAHNQYFMVGRKDDTVKVSGFRVNLSDVDAYIQTLEKVKDSATLYVDDEKQGQCYLVSYVILSEDAELADVQQALKQVLPSFQLPKQLLPIEAFPLNHSGKICKKTLLTQYLESHAI